MYVDAARITRAARTANCRVFIIRLAIGEEVRALLIRASELHCTPAVSYIASRLIMSGVRADVYDDIQCHFMNPNPNLTCDLGVHVKMTPSYINCCSII